MSWVSELSPQQQARMAGMFSLVHFFVSLIAVLLIGRDRIFSEAAFVLATLLYAVVVLLFYALFQSSDSTYSLIAAISGFLGCGLTILKIALHVPFPFYPIVFFGMYFCLIGWLIVEYGLLPRALGVLILLGGLSWLTMLLPPLGNTLSPYNVGFGVLVRAALTVWLLAADVEVPSEIDEFAS